MQPCHPLLQRATALLLHVTLSASCMPPAIEPAFEDPGSDLVLIDDDAVGTLVLTVLIVGGIAYWMTQQDGQETSRTRIGSVPVTEEPTALERSTEEAMSAALWPRRVGERDILGIFGFTPADAGQSVVKMVKIAKADTSDQPGTYWRTIESLTHTVVQEEYRNDGMCLVARVHHLHRNAEGSITSREPYYGAVKISAEQYATAPVTRAIVRAIKIAHAAAAATAVSVGKCIVAARLGEELCRNQEVPAHEFCQIDGSVELVVKFFEHGTWHHVGELLGPHAGQLGLGAHALLKMREGAHLLHEYVEHCSLPAYFKATRTRCDGVRDLSELGAGFTALP